MLLNGVFFYKCVYDYEFDFELNELNENANIFVFLNECFKLRL